MHPPRPDDNSCELFNARLAIVRTIVDAHGGVVRARSRGVGRGSEFVIELPAVDSAPVQ